MDIDHVPLPTFAPMSFPPSDSFNPSLSSSLDQNSPILFKRNLEFVQREVVRVQGLAQDVLAGISGAYSVGMEPMNTKRLIADLKQSLDNLTSLLRTTGVGALPLLPPPPAPQSASSFSDVPSAPRDQDATQIPTEPELLSYANESVKTLYDSLKRKQESAAVVANLLQQVVVGNGSQGGYAGVQRQGDGEWGEGRENVVFVRMGDCGGVGGRVGGGGGGGGAAYGVCAVVDEEATSHFVSGTRHNPLPVSNATILSISSTRQSPTHQHRRQVLDQQAMDASPPMYRQIVGEDDTDLIVASMDSQRIQTHTASLRVGHRSSPRARSLDPSFAIMIPIPAMYLPSYYQRLSAQRLYPSDLPQIYLPLQLNTHHKFSESERRVVYPYSDGLAAMRKQARELDGVESVLVAHLAYA